MRGKTDLALLRHERNAPGIVFTRLIEEPLIVRPPSVASQPLAGVAPTIDLSLGYNEANTSVLLKAIVGKIEDLTSFGKRRA